MKRVFLMASVIGSLVGAGHAAAQGNEGKGEPLRSRAGWVQAVWDGSRTTGTWIATRSFAPGATATLAREGQAERVQATIYFEDLYETEGVAFISEAAAIALGIEADTSTRVHVTVNGAGPGMVWGEDDAVEYQDVQQIFPEELWPEDGGAPMVEAIRDDDGNLVNRIRLKAAAGPTVFAYGDSGSQTGGAEVSERPFRYHVVIDGLNDEPAAARAEQMLHREGVRSAIIERAAGRVFIQAGPFDNQAEAEAVLREARNHGLESGRVERSRAPAGG